MRQKIFLVVQQMFYRIRGVMYFIMVAMAAVVEAECQINLKGELSGSKVIYR